MTTAQVGEFGGARTHVLRASDGTEAHVLPSIGATCIALRVPLTHGPLAGAMADVLAPPDDFAAFRDHPTGWGMAILSPHPGGTQSPFEWQGRTYDPAAGAGRLSGHGFAAQSSWEVVEATADHLVCRLDSRTLPTADYWPWPYTLTATHRAIAGGLLLELAYDTHSAEPAPLLLGLHPYFPWRTAGPTADPAHARETCAPWVAADTLWQREPEAVGSTGATSVTAGTREPGRRGGGGGGRMVAVTEGVWDLRRDRSGGPRSVAALERAYHATLPVDAPADRVPLRYYVDPLALAAANQQEADPAAPGGVASGVLDHVCQLAVTLETSRAFAASALYFPPGQPALSHEPRTTLPDPLRLATTHPDQPTGLWAVHPGHTWRAWARITTAPIPSG